jgi:hypothetical protein
MIIEKSGICSGGFLFSLNVPWNVEPGMILAYPPPPPPLM